MDADQLICLLYLLCRQMTFPPESLETVRDRITCGNEAPQTRRPVFFFLWMTTFTDRKQVEELSSPVSLSHGMAGEKNWMRARGAVYKGAHFPTMESSVQVNTRKIWLQGQDHRGWPRDSIFRSENPQNSRDRL
jgi:hypothetical protein